MGEKDKPQIVVPNEPIMPALPGISAESLIAQAIDKNVPVETMERLLVMRRELKAEKAKEEFDQAMADFQANCPVIEKKKKIDFTSQRTGRRTNYNYAPLDVIVEQVKELIKKNGFSYKINTIVDSDWVTAICRVTHKLGHSEESEFKVPIDKEAFMNSAQKFASALTFAKRYAFCNSFGILTGDEDDDSMASGNETAKTDQKHATAQSRGSGSYKKPQEQKSAPWQFKKVMEVVEMLGKTKSDLLSFLKVAYKVDNFEDLTYRQGYTVLNAFKKKLSQLPESGPADSSASDSRPLSEEELEAEINNMNF